jgi:hypothetical protein
VAEVRELRGMLKMYKEREEVGHLKGENSLDLVDMKIQVVED